MARCACHMFPAVGCITVLHSVSMTACTLPFCEAFGRNRPCLLCGFGHCTFQHCHLTIGRCYVQINVGVLIASSAHAFNDKCSFLSSVIPWLNFITWTCWNTVSTFPLCVHDSCVLLYLAVMTELMLNLQGCKKFTASWCEL